MKSISAPRQRRSNEPDDSLSLGQLPNLAQSSDSIALRIAFLHPDLGIGKSVSVSTFLFLFTSLTLTTSLSHALLTQLPSAQCPHPPIFFSLVPSFFQKFNFREKLTAYQLSPIQILPLFRQNFTRRSGKVGGGCRFGTSILRTPCYYLYFSS